MKVNSSNVKSLVSQIQNSQVKGVLFFGPDYGVADACSRHLSKHLGISSAEQITYAKLVDDPQQILLTASLFNDRTITKIKDVAGVFDKTLKAVLEQSLVTIPLFFAGELPPSSAIRKFFETSSDYAAIGCYVDDHVQVSKIIASKLLSVGKKVEPDAVSFLEHHLTGNRMLVVSELDKLIAYSHDKEEISLSMVEEVISTSITSSADLMCIHFALGEIQSFEDEVQKLLKESISPIWIIRALLRYYSNLYVVLLQHEYGTPYQVAIKSLKPTIFFKYVPAFKNALEGTNHQEVIEIMQGLCHIESMIKQGHIADHLVLHHLTLLNIKFD